MVRDQTPAAEFPALLPELREITVGTSKPACLDMIMAMLRSRGGSRAAGVVALQRVRVVFLHRVSPWLSGEERPAVPARVTCFQMELQEWVSEMEKEKDDSGMVEASLDIMTLGM